MEDKGYFRKVCYIDSSRYCLGAGESLELSPAALEVIVTPGTSVHGLLFYCREDYRVYSGSEISGIVVKQLLLALYPKF